MANNVYIGSRYVPIFDGTWNASKVYEPLTIVEYGNSSYTSKRQVPAGTLPTNTTYWALTGNYNGLIAALQNDVAQNTQDIEDIQNTISEKTEIVVFGDSWAHSGTSQLQTALRNHFPSCTVHNYSVGGAKFTGPNTYYSQAATFNADTTFDKTKIKFVVLILGVNDFRGGLTRADFNSNLNALYDNIFANIEKVPCYWLNSYTAENDWTASPSRDLLTQYNYFYAISWHIARKISPILSFDMVSEMDTANYFHPTDGAYTTLFDNLCRCILGVPYKRFRYGGERYVGVVNDPNISGAFADFFIEYWLTDGILTIKLHIATAGAYSVASGTNAIFTRDLPYNVPDRLLIGVGVNLRPQSDHKTIKLVVINATEHTNAGYTSTSTGYIEQITKVQL